MIGFERIWSDLVAFGWVWAFKFEWILLDVHDCKNGRLGWVRIDLGIFGELGLVNLIGLFDFYGFNLFGWIWVDFN